MDHLTADVRNKGATEYPAQHLYPGQSFGLGFGVITNPAQTGVISSMGAYSWGGAANTKFLDRPRGGLDRYLHDPSDECAPLEISCDSI